MGCRAATAPLVMGTYACCVLCRTTRADMCFISAPCTVMCPSQMQSSLQMLFGSLLLQQLAGARCTPWKL